MQDRTINNALLAIYRRKDAQAALAAEILRLRGVDMPPYIHDRPFRRREAQYFALAMLPCTSSRVADAIQSRLPGISRKSACQGAYMALRRLEAAGVARPEGRVCQDIAKFERL